ncbi:MAG: tetratricopeptide repeat protein [Herpetosiphonaceae bacterium]|nr:tetratricopeptide repeat protein [Herpetosiphonaceae bacterium]
MNPHQLHTITFLFTDIEGSTKLWEQFPSAMQVALASHDTILRAAITAQQGHIFKTIGDAFCGAFSSPIQAVAAMVAAQTQLVAAEWPEVGSLRVRMALHSGSVEMRDGDYFGPPLNRVARLLAAANGGQMLVSQVVAANLQAVLPAAATLHDLGEHRLKDLIRPERIFQLTHRSLPADFPPLRSLAAFAHNLPIQLTSFIGREREMSEVKSLLPSTRLLTLTGPGGTGKTRLSLQVAAEMLDTFADGVWLVELAPLADPALVVQAVAATLGVREDATRPLLASLADYINTQDLLLILDNCEHVIDAVAQFVAALLQRCPQIHVLVSSRETLGIPGETAVRVPSLALPNLQPPPALAQLAQYEAVRLFIDRAALAQPGWTFSPENASTIAHICVRLDGIPLAIELAAARVKVLQVEQIAARLDDRFRLLTGGSRTALPRQQTLRALIDWSYDLLTDAERTVLRRLAVFVGGWTLEAAEQVCADDALDQAEVLDLLIHLVNKSLVAVEQEGSSETRYRLLETIRQYARDKLLESGETLAVREQHRRWYLQAIERDAYEIGRSDLDNVRAALEWCQDLPAGTEDGLRATTAMAWFWNSRGLLSEGRGWLDMWLNNGVPVPPLVRANGLLVNGILAFRQDVYSRALELNQEALAIGQALEDADVIAQACRGLGDIGRAQANFSQAVRWYEQSIATLEDREPGPALLMPLSNLGITLYHQGLYPKALQLLTRAVAIARLPGDENSSDLLWPLRNLGMVQQALGLLAESRRALEQSVAICRRNGVDGALAYPLNNLGYGYFIAGDYTQAEVFCAEALALFRRVGDRWGVAYSLANLGRVAFASRDVAQAQVFYAESLAIFHDLHAIALLPEAMSGMAGVWAEQGAIQQSVRLCGAAAALLTSIGAQFTPTDQALFERILQHTQARMLPAEWRALWDEGQHTTLERVFEEILHPEAIV